MARSLNAAALSKIATDYGTEPINIIGIQWVSGGPYQLYSDRDIGTSVKGAILELSEIDNVVTASLGSDSQEISVVLDDTDGSLKNIFDHNDIHKRDVIVYQWFEGLSLDDRFILFTGKINSPVVWNEGEQTLSFDVINQLEDLEVGFSAEEGQFPQIPDELIGEPWPVVFGTVIDLPALNINKTITGTTQQGVGIISGGNLHSNHPTDDGSNRNNVGLSLGQISVQISHNNRVKAALRRALTQIELIVSEKAQKKRNELNAQIDSLRANNNELRKSASQISFRYAESQRQIRQRRSQESSSFNSPTNIGPSVIRILGGEDFPQGVPVDLDIRGGIFTGVFDCQNFYITSRRHPDNEAKAASVNNFADNGVSQQPQDTGYNFVTANPARAVGLNEKPEIKTHGFFVLNHTQDLNRVDQIAQHFWADAGSQVQLLNDLKQNYIVSVVPGTVLAVKAFKQFGAQRKLVNVPRELWSQVDIDYGPVTAVTVQLTKQLSEIPDQNWDDDIYVTFESDVGPNFVNILEYILDKWSNLSTDTTSFNAVRSKVANFPMNFARLERDNVIDLMKRLAYQARCAAFVKGNTAYLKFLPEEPASTETTITEGDIVPKTMQVGFTPTEDIITKMVLNFRLTYAPEGGRRLILRHNVAKYGTQTSDEDWFAYTNPDVVRHCATFWLIRKSNSWKKVRFQTYLDKLNIETFDAVTLDFNKTYASTGDIKSIVETASYNSGDNTIDFEVLTPVKTGTMTAYPFFWPSAVDAVFPAPGDFGGGGGIGVQASGVLPASEVNVAQKCVDGGGIFIGGPNVVYSGPADQGAPQLNDSNFSVQPLVFPGTDFTIEPGVNPNPSLRVSYEPKFVVPPIPEMPNFSTFVIDLSSTPVIDSSNPGKGGFFSDFIREITDDNELVIDTEAKFSDGENVESFDFKYDSSGEKFGAGTAFLQDEDEE